jgi:hypothetical protein
VHGREGWELIQWLLDFNLSDNSSNGPVVVSTSFNDTLCKLQPQLW